MAQEQENVLTRALPSRSRSASPEALKDIFVALEKVLAESNVKLAVITCGKLSTFYKLRGQISLSERGELAELLFKVLYIPTHSLHTQVKVVQALCRIIGKRRVGLKIKVDWKALWNIIERIHLQLDENVPVAGSQVRSGHAGQLANLCLSVRRYLTESDIDDITSLAYSWMEDPLSRNQFVGQAVLFLFMPSVKSTKYQKHLSRWMELWERVDHSAEWDASWMHLVRRAIKWGGASHLTVDEVAQLHRRIQDGLQLSPPAGVRLSCRVRAPSQLSKFRSPSSRMVQQAGKVAMQLVGCGTAADFYALPASMEDKFTPNSKDELEACLEADKDLSAGFLYLRKLLSSIQTLFHPSNSSSYHGDSVATFAAGLCEGFAKRLGRERAALGGHTPFGDPGAPLTTADKVTFVDTMLPLLKMACYSKSRTMTHWANLCLTNLAYIAPVKVSNMFLPIIYDALDPSNLHQTHQAPAAIGMLGALVQPLLQARPILAELLPTFLELSLPGLDANDTSKTVKTCVMLQQVLGWVPIIDVSELDFPTSVDWKTHELSLSDSYGIDTPEDLAGSGGDELARDAMWRGSPVLVEWSLACLDRILAFIDTQVGRAKSGYAARLDHAILSNMSLTTKQLFSQMHAPVRTKAGKRLHEWALGSVNVDAMKENKLVIRSYVSVVFAGTDKEVKQMLSGLFEPLLETVSDKSNAERKRETGLVLLGAIVRVAGHWLLQYEADLMTAINVSIADKSKSIRKQGGKLLRRTLRGLSEQYIQTAAVNPVLEGAPKPAELAKAAVSWGQPLSWPELADQVKDTWHMPSEEEIGMSNRLKKHYLSVGFEGVSGGLEKSGKDRSDAVRKYLEVLFQVCRGCSTLWESFSERAGLIGRLCDLLPTFINELDSDTVVHRRVMKTIQELLIGYGSSSGRGNMLDSREAFVAYYEGMNSSSAYRAEINACVESDLVKDRKDIILSRYFMLLDINTLFKRHQHQLAYEQAQQNHDAGSEDVLETCWLSLMQANQHDWKDTRHSAQVVLHEIMRIAPWFAKFKVAEVLPMLAADQGSHGRVLGASALLNKKQALRWICSDWNLLSTYMSTVVFETPTGLLRLDDDKQKEANEAVQMQTVSILAAWSTLPITEEVQEKTRKEMFESLTNPAQSAGLNWRQKMIVCFFLLTISLERDDPLLTPSVLSWVAECATSEMLPLRSTAISCLVQLLVKVPAASLDKVLNGLALSDSFYKALVDTLSQEHSNAHTSVDGNTQGLKQKSDWSVGVGDLLRLVRFPVSLREGKTFVWANSKTFMKGHKCLIQKLCVLVGDPAIKGLTKQLDYLLFENVHTAEYQSMVATAAEVVSGIESVSLDDKVLTIALKKLSESTLESAGVWLDTLRLCSNADVLKSAFEELLGELAASVDKKENISEAVVTCNVARGLRALVYELAHTLSHESLRQTIRVALSALNHPFEKVRLELGRLVVSSVEVLERIGGPDRESVASEAISAVLGASSELERSSEASDSSRITETSLNVAYYLVSGGGPARSKYIMDFIPVVLNAQGHPNQDLDKIARKTAQTLCSLPLPSASRAIETVKVASLSVENSESNWHARQSGCLLLGAMLNVNSAVLGYAAGAIYCRKEIEKLLRDPQVEVQQIASVTLTEVFSTYLASSPSLAVSRDRYIKLAATKIKKDQLKTDDGKAKLKKRTTGVLGLTAIVHSSPYTVPFPNAVVALAKRVNDPSPVGKYAKDAVQAFKHTHTDSWAETKTHFTSEELEDLQDSSYSGAHA